MRSVFDFQVCLDTVPISEIEIDPRSRDIISRFLYAMQQIFRDSSASQELFRLLEQEYKSDTRKDRGCPGMLLWRVFLLAALKQATDCTYDRLAFFANELGILRLMLGHGTQDPKRYTRQALHDNVSALSPELLQKVNLLVVDVGHRIVGQSEDALLRCRCDSKVVKSNIHFPTDLSLLRDSVRCVLRQSHKWAAVFGLAGWREYKSYLHKIHKAFQGARKGRKKSYNRKKVKSYLHLCRKIHGKVEHQLLTPLEEDLDELNQRAIAGQLSKEEAVEMGVLTAAIHEISLFLDYMELFLDQITRRILQDETIPPEEKVFSIFKPFTRWVVKGKVGILCELGVPVAFLEDEHQFILGYGIEWTGTDKDYAVALIKEVLQKHPSVELTCSFDTGFYSVAVLEELRPLLAGMAMPKKGPYTKKERARRNAPAYQEARKGHPGVESCMNHLNHRGLSLVREVHPENFERVIATSVLAANLCRLGMLVRSRERKRLKRLKNQRERYRRAA